MNEEENSNTELSWSVLEYETKERSKDWFWALGVIVFAVSAAALIYGNYFFAILIIISGALLGFYATREPDMVRYEIVDKGIVINSRLFPFKEVKSFFVQKEPKPILFVKTRRVFMPVVNIPIEEDMMERIHQIFLESEVIEEEMKEHPSEKIMDVLGF
ncbi:MAG: hypothetical protein KBD55_01280 [Candidatus Pacebacteria bacterium]|nr:hypothetical protein [Candidatus Paceibacterota bacterium]